LHKQGGIAKLEQADKKTVPQLCHHSLESKVLQGFIELKSFYCFYSAESWGFSDIQSSGLFLCSSGFIHLTVTSTPFY
jgi:hypothetical protein